MTAPCVVVHLHRADGLRMGVPAIVLGVLAIVVAVARFGPERS